MTTHLTLNAFEALTRNDQYEELKRLDPTRAKGHSRSAKATLRALYLETIASIPVAEMIDHPYERLAELPTEDKTVIGVDLGTGPDKTAVVLVTQDAEGNFSTHDTAEDAAKAMLKGDTNMTGHAHGPDCHHEVPLELPQVHGVQEIVRANPDLPTMPFQDGAVIPLPPAANEPDYVLKETSLPGPLNGRQARIFMRFELAYKKFCENAANSTARRDARSAAYDLKVAGVILNPKLLATLADGAKQVRDARRAHKLGGGDLKDLLKEKTA